MHPFFDADGRRANWDVPSSRQPPCGGHDTDNEGCLRAAGSTGCPNRRCARSGMWYSSAMTLLNDSAVSANTPRDSTRTKRAPSSRARPACRYYEQTPFPYGGGLFYPCSPLPCDGAFDVPADRGHSTSRADPASGHFREIDSSATSSPCHGSIPSRVTCATYSTPNYERVLAEGLDARSARQGHGRRRPADASRPAGRHPRLAGAFWPSPLKTPLPALSWP